MEGRHPPPKASHPFPNAPDLRKFWGTPAAKGFFKTVLVFLSVYGSLCGIQLYLLRDVKGPFGMDITMTEEQTQKRYEAILARAKNFPIIEGITFNMNDEIRNPNFRFDDGVGFDTYIKWSPFQDKPESAKTD